MVIEIKKDLSQGTGIRLRERYENVCPIWGFEILRDAQNDMGGQNSKRTQNSSA